MKLGEEKKQNYKYYCYLNGTLIGDAISKLYVVGNKLIQVKLRFINGDNKGIWALLSNKYGGNKRCWGCKAPFCNEHIRDNFFFHIYSSYSKKGLKENFLFF